MSAAANSSRPTADEDSLTFNPPFDRAGSEEEARSWKNGYYFELGDQELRLIVWKAESIDDSYEFSDGKIRSYKPISNLLWKQMTRKKRELQDIQSRIIPGDIKSLVQMEEDVDAYYAKMCEIYFEMSREEYDNLPPAETMLTVKAANHKTIHPLKIGKRQGQGRQQQK